MNASLIKFTDRNGKFAIAGWWLWGTYIRVELMLLHGFLEEILIQFLVELNVQNVTSLQLITNLYALIRQLFHLCLDTCSLDWRTKRTRCNHFNNFFQFTKHGSMLHYGYKCYHHQIRRIEMDLRCLIWRYGIFYFQIRSWCT